MTANRVENFDLAKRSLIDATEVDRSGAATISIMNDMVNRLESIHQEHYQALDISWGL